MRAWRKLFACAATAAAFLLTACGGGGSSEPDIPPPVNRAPVASASGPSSVTVGATVILDGSASQDPDGDALRYRWSVSAQPAGAGATLSDPTQARPSFVATLAGSYVLTLVVSDGSLDSAAASVTVQVQPDTSSALTIVLDPPEPVSGVVVFTLSGAHDGRVSWLLDAQPLGPVEGSENAMMSWNSVGASAGSHLIVARLHAADGNWSEVRRIFQVAGALPTNRAPTAAASGPARVAVGATVTLDGSASRDPDGDALSYRWSISAQPAGAGAALDDATRQSPRFVATRAGSYTLSLVVSDGVLSSAAAVLTVLAEADSSGALTIVLDQPEPVSGTVVFTLSGVHDGRVSWYLDAQLLGPAEGSLDATMSWDGTRASLGAHLIVARLHAADGSWREIRRNFALGPPPITLEAVTRNWGDTLAVDVGARTRYYPIVRVSATIDGRPLGSLDTPNSCGPLFVAGCLPPYGGYLFEIDREQAGPGRHALVFTATDTMGRVGTLNYEIVIGPVVTMLRPRTGDVIYGTLELEGRVRGQPPADTRIEVLLGSTPVLNARGSEFRGSYDLSGLPANRYAITLSASDGSGLVTREVTTIAVAPSPAWVRAPNFYFGPNNTLMLARGSRVLYSTASAQALRLHDMDSGAEVVLQFEGSWTAGSTGLDASSLDIGSDGRVYALSGQEGCNGKCLVQWGSSGARRNLSADNTYVPDLLARVTDSAPRVQGSQVLWMTSAGSRQRLVLHDAARNSFTLVAPDGSQLTGAYDLSVRDGVTTVVWASGNPGGASPRYALHVWRSDTGVSRLLTEAGGQAGRVRTDGERVFWVHVETPAGGANQLLAMPVAGGALPALVAPISSSFELQEDGSLSWGQSLYLNGTIKTLPTLPFGGHVFAAGAGWIFYVDAGNMLNAWNASSGVSEPMFDAHAHAGWVTSGHVVFQFLEGVYRIPLTR
jgi:hypothetical protein